MTIQVRSGATWRPTVAGRLMYARVAGAWKPVLDLWVRDQGAWHKEPTYSAPALLAPSNIRMNPADVNNHNSFSIIWDWTQPTNGLTPSQFEVVLTDEAGNWLVDVAVDPGARTYNFTGLNQNTRYQAYVRARYAGGGRPDTAFAGPLRWATGADSYVVYDVPVYDWRNEFEWMPPAPYNYTSAANGDTGQWGFGRALDNNFSTYWNSNVVSEANGDGNQGEGWMVQPPGGHFLFTGIRMWTINPHTTWLGIWNNGVWQGGSVPYANTGKYPSFYHAYVVGVDQSAAGTNPTIRGGNYVTDVGAGLFIAGLMQYPGYDGFNWRMEVIELRLLLMQWTLIGYNPRTVAAVNSAYW